ncbi:hypothetical protein [Streptomyces coffeae]|uniref:Uncharacterized protein n=1 Tax=Streptomyces coffeae TaxID=621382 RepID=A0ABS1N9U7_9ACTN|nr:hypothetical protein [Streptomyces coffeae]MBL1096705.1 hypothetical protein [Streptomyces coffeae]
MERNRRVSHPVHPDHDVHPVPDNHDNHDIHDIHDEIEARLIALVEGRLSRDAADR